MGYLLILSALPGLAMVVYAFLRFGPLLGGRSGIRRRPDLVPLVSLSGRRGEADRDRTHRSGSLPAAEQGLRSLLVPGLSPDQHQAHRPSALCDAVSADVPADCWEQASGAASRFRRPCASCPIFSRSRTEAFSPMPASSADIAATSALSRSAPNRIGTRSFVGNSALVPVGIDIGDNGLIGVMSTPPPRRAAHGGRHTLARLARFRAAAHAGGQPVQRPADIQPKRPARGVAGDRSNSCG